MLERLTEDLKHAMMNGDALVVSVLRMLKSELHNAKITLGTDLSEEETIKIVRREVKKRSEAAAGFRSGNSEDRAAAEDKEAEILKQYLPAAVDPALIEASARRILAELPDRSPRQKGALIQTLMKEFAGKVDGSEISALASRLFAE